MEILLIPCIMRMLILVGRLGSFLRKKYPPTSPSEKNSLSLPFFLFVSIVRNSKFDIRYSQRIDPRSIFPDEPYQLIDRLCRRNISLDYFLSAIQCDPSWPRT